MGSGSLAELIAEIEAAVRRVLKAVQAFAGSFRPKAPAQPPAAPSTHLGEYERFEESKYYPGRPSYALKLEEGVLPESYGKTRVVLLVVDPNLVHAYWEVAPEKFWEAKSRMGESAQAVLRFYEDSGSFDVEVDLGPRNWYVRLWSPGKSYYVDLGLRAEDGGFVQLARSNAVHTPRALPVAEVGERFMRAAAPGRPAEIVPPPPYRKPRRPHAALQPPAPISPAVPAGSGPPGADLAKVPASGSAPPPAAAGSARPMDSEEILKSKLAEFCALREWHREPLSPEETPARGSVGPWPEEGYPDLTELAENHQTMGLSSALQQGRPER